MRHRRFRASLIPVILLNVLLFCLTASFIILSHRQHLSMAEQTAGNLSRVLEANLADAIDRIDLNLKAVIDEVEREQRAGGIDRAAIERFLAVHDARLPEALGLRVADAEGRMVYAVSNVGTANVSIADREHFIRLRDNPDLGMVISKPLLGRVSSQTVILFARRINAPDGSFAGAVQASVPIDRLAARLGTVDLGPLGNVGLWDDTPVLLARYSKISVPNSGVTPSPTLRELIRTGALPTFYHTRSGVDGIERLFAFRKVGPWPLYLVVGLADEDFLAGWRRESVFLAVFTAFVMALLTASTLRLNRSMRQAESAGRRTDLILASAGEGICGIGTDGRVVFLNQAARRMLGWTDDEGLGEDFHAATHHSHADGTPYASADCPLHWVASGKARETLHVSDDLYWRRDGSAFHVEYTVAPLAEDGDVVGAVNVFRDISEKRRAENEMRVLLNKQQAVLTSIPIGIVVVGFDRRIREANPAFYKILNRTPADTIGQTTRILYVSDEQFCELGERAYPIIRQGLVFRDDVRMRRSDGREVWIRLGSQLIDDADPEAGIVWTLEDITARKALELDITRSNAELEQFAYVASHDLRQPLRMVTSYLTILGKRLAGRLETEEQEFFGFAMGGAQRMDALVQGLLEYSRVGRTGQAGPVPLGPVIEDALHNLKVAIADAGAQVAVAADFPTVRGDRMEMMRLFQNLIGNAVKYRHPERPPRVEVGWCLSDGEWLFSVRDNGIGIAAEDRERAFKVFQRLVGEQVEGTGIGLAICRKIVETMGGRIWIDSEPGVGSTFLFTLPRVDGASA